MAKVIKAIPGYGFLLFVHVVPVVAIFMGTAAQDWIALVLMYMLLGMFGVSAGLHRYFAHRSFSTGPVFRFFLGWAACMTFTDPVTFAGKHRIHHRHSDDEKDVHGPRFGVWQSWFGSLVNDGGYSLETIRGRAKDILAFPEIALLLMWWLGGFTMFAVGYALAIVFVIHATSSTNYICHRYGTRRFSTRDESTNNAWINILGLGEGWHNNHHHYPGSARYGLGRGEWDPTFRMISLMARLGVVRDVHDVPEHVRESARAEVAA